MWPAKYPWKYYAGDTMCEQLQSYLGHARGCVVSDYQHDVYILNWTDRREGARFMLIKSSISRSSSHCLLSMLSPRRRNSKDSI